MVSNFPTQFQTLVLLVEKSASACYQTKKNDRPKSKCLVRGLVFSIFEINYRLIQYKILSFSIRMNISSYLSFKTETTYSVTFHQKAGRKKNALRVMFGSSNAIRLIVGHSEFHIHLLVLVNLTLSSGVGKTTQAR